MQTQDTHERLHLWAGLRCFSIPPECLEEVFRKWEVWAPQLKSLYFLNVSLLYSQDGQLESHSGKELNIDDKQMLDSLMVYYF